MVDFARKRLIEQLNFALCNNHDKRYLYLGIDQKSL